MPSVVDELGPTRNGFPTGTLAMHFNLHPAKVIFGSAGRHPAIIIALSGAKFAAACACAAVSGPVAGGGFRSASSIG